MSRIPRDYVHPDPRPSAAEQPLTYAVLITQIAEQALESGYHSVRDLPELALEHIAVVLQQFPTAFIDSIAEADPDLTALVTDRLGDTDKTVTERYSHIGLLVVGFVRAYVKSLVLRDVQTKCGYLREVDALEDRLSHREVLGADAELACELGLGRSLS